MALVFPLVVTLTIFFILLTILSQILKPNNNNLLPPGKLGWLMGETTEFVSNPEKFVHDRMKNYCPEIFKTSVIGQKVAFLCGPAANKFIFSNENKLFNFWLPPSVAAILSVTNIDMSSESSKMVTEEIHRFLKLEAMHHYVPIMDSEAIEHVNTYWAPYKEVKVQALSKQFTFTLACCLFINYHKWDQIKELAENFVTMCDGTIALPINIPGTAYHRARQREKALRKKLVSIIKQRKLELSEMKGDGDSQCLLNRVLMATNKNGVFINEDDLAGRIISLLFASFFTTSNTITFVLSYLAKYPHVYSKVLQEQLEIVQSKGTGELLNWKDIQKMRYTWNVVCESMRLRPPAFGSFREAAIDITYAGFQIPKGWKVHWNVHSTNMDPKYFPEPEKFDPSRFEGSKLPPFTFVPFGGGPRMCAGKEYTRIEILSLLHNVVTKFKLSEVNPDEKIIYNPNPEPVDGLRVRLQPLEM